MRFFAKIPSKEFQIEVNGLPPKNTIKIDGKTIAAEFQEVGNYNLFLLLVNQRSYQTFIERRANGYHVTINNNKYFVEVEDQRTRQIRQLIKADEQPHRQVEIKAPMPGLIVKIPVKEGDEIRKGDSLVIIEAMKMENDIRASAAGRIKKIFKKEKASVDKDAILMVIE